MNTCLSDHNATQTTSQITPHALKFEVKCPDSSSLNPKFIVSCKYQSYYKKLRTQYKLDQLIKNTTNELEVVATVMNWVNHLWEHHPEKTPRKKDAYSILHEVLYEHQNFRCVEYATVLTACLWALDIPCRKLCLKTEDVEDREYAAGHIVCEAFLPSLKKWVMLDPQANIIIKLGKKPLNAVELQKAIAQKRKITIYAIDTDVTIKEYINFITQYLYYFDTPLELNNPYQSKQQLMLVPLHAKKPRRFQQHTILNGFLYTNSKKCFYPKLCSNF